MPSSRPDIIPIVINLLRQSKVQSILDVGVGFGKWGHLFREYTDILEAEHDPGRYEKKNWRVRIDGIEGYASYLTPMHTFLYDHIYLGDAGALIKTLPNYDFIFMGDIIEHFDKDAGLSLLRDAIAHANKAVVVSTPKYETGQDNLCGNELERHKSLWKASDFRRLGNAQVKTVAGNMLLAAFRRTGLPKLKFSSAGKVQQSALLLQRLPQEIREHIPAGAKFILVDEEQIRNASRVERALPFLEKNGEYWGAPGDDDTAIKELERMRQADAQFLVFVPSTFWWLDYYKEFQRHLRSHYSCIRDDERLIVFDLRP